MQATDVQLEKEESQREYEIAFLVRDEGEVGGISRLLAQHDAHVAFAGPVKKIALAYPVAKETHACFGYFHARMTPGQVPTLERDLEMNKNVLRVLIMKSPFVRERTVSVSRPRGVSAPQRPLEVRTSLPLSNEALEKKIEEILQ
jgi:ribosomal protein S6